GCCSLPGRYLPASSTLRAWHTRSGAAFRAMSGHPTGAVSFVEVVESAEPKISTVTSKTGLSNNAVLSELRPGLLALGYVVESGKTRATTIRRPVLFGENGRAEVNYEIDAFHDELGVAVEVEAGRGRQIMRTTETSSERR